ncbi:MAG: HAD family phosphatase [Candidatus Ancaeobacter aquaticus]|nr:HAD family phosphatase [Candidatus Ancaeobacter aquaticus]
MKKIKKEYKAVIFDMDGVIVDSMPYHFLAWYEALRPIGVRISSFDVYMREGERWQKTVLELLEREHIKITDKLTKKIHRDREQIFKRIYKRFIFQGSFELLECLNKKEYSLGLVTGTPTKEVKKILPKKIRDIFKCIVAGDSVVNGKPHPEPYLRAAEILGVTPSECIVIENAPLGIRSAQQAGMVCVAVTTSLPREYVKNADHIVDSNSATKYFSSP